MAYFNPHACLTLGEQIIENSLKFVFRNHQHCVSDAFFKFAACMWIVLPSFLILICFYLLSVGGEDYL